MSMSLPFEVESRHGRARRQAQAAKECQDNQPSGLNSSSSRILSPFFRRYLTGITTRCIPTALRILPHEDICSSERLKFSFHISRVSHWHQYAPDLNKAADITTCEGLMLPSAATHLYESRHGRVELLTDARGHWPHVRGARLSGQIRRGGCHRSAWRQGKLSRPDLQIPDAIH
jgi:hypothetical protein